MPINSVFSINNAIIISIIPIIKSTIKPALIFIIFTNTFNNRTIISDNTVSTCVSTSSRYEIMFMKNRTFFVIFPFVSFITTITETNTAGKAVTSSYIFISNKSFFISISFSYILFMATPP